MTVTPITQTLPTMTPAVIDDPYRVVPMPRPIVPPLPIRPPLPWQPMVDTRPGHEPII